MNSYSKNIQIAPIYNLIMENNKIIEEEIIKSINNKEDISLENIKKAEKIGFKNHLDKVVTTDKYGFINDK